MQDRLSPGSPAIPMGQNSNRRCSRDLLPLPEVAVSSRPSAKLSRRSQQKLGRQRHFEEEVNGVIQSLNQMYGAARVRSLGFGKHVHTELSAVQRKTYEFIERAVSELGPPGELSGSEALEELRVSTGYEALPISCPLASFDPDLIALPSEGMTPVPLDSLWGESGQHEVEKFCQRRMLDPDEVRDRLEASGVRRCYQDPKLNDPKIYADFARRLLDLNLVDVSLQAPKEHVGLFFVKKKNNRIRIIMDSRRSNCHFEDPEHVHLAAGEAMSRMQLPQDKTVYVASADLQNAFYTMVMPMQLRELFGLRAVRAGLLGMIHVEGRPVSSNTFVHCRIAVIPMGWTWALWWCQRVNERICERSGLAEGDRLRDGIANLGNSFWHIQYVDNLHVFGTDRQQVESRFWSAVQGLRDAGLTVHEIEFDEGQSKVLGWELEEGGILRPSRKRIWRIRLAIREILRRGRASGQQIERLIGTSHLCLCVARNPWRHSENATASFGSIMTRLYPSGKVCGASWACGMAFHLCCLSIWGVHMTTEYIVLMLQSGAWVSLLVTCHWRRSQNLKVVMSVGVSKLGMLEMQNLMHWPKTNVSSRKALLPAKGSNPMPSSEQFLSVRSLGIGQLLGDMPGTDKRACQFMKL